MTHADTQAAAQYHIGRPLNTAVAEQLRTVAMAEKIFVIFLAVSGKRY